ncbi:MAG: hypothetical protein U1A25_02555 [Candidatus Sungbacteria bacterium]|nr:hypothetical protein [bacterium]MDZ4260522.1 hypothetical protein [Candidatus Sungbacteria bacterium]
MKMVEEGIWFEFVCPSCKSKYQAEPQDATTRPNYDRDGDCVGHIYVVTCGKCGQYIDLPSRKITEKIRQIADNKRVSQEAKW